MIELRQILDIWLRPLSKCHIKYLMKWLNLNPWWYKKQNLRFCKRVSCLHEKLSTSDFLAKVSHHCLNVEFNTTTQPNVPNHRWIRVDRSAALKKKKPKKFCVHFLSTNDVEFYSINCHTWARLRKEWISRCMAR